jgi:hypothetical protein
MNLNINIPNILKFRTYFFNININLTEYSKNTETNCQLYDVLIAILPSFYNQNECVLV